ncbi:MAG: family 16 glycoside hydrolase [Phycisphaerae bacterium]
MTNAEDRAVWLSFALLAALGACAAQACGGAKDKRLDVYWVDVEGGAATLMVTPAGESVLVDTGLDGQRDPDRIAALAGKIAGLKQIDHLVITHFDVDHHGGAAELAKRIPIRKVYDPGNERARPHPSYDKYLGFRKTVPYVVLKPGDTIPLRQADGAAQLSVTCLASAKRFIQPAPQDERNEVPPAKLPEYPLDRSENANSIVLLLRFGAFDLLDAADLTGQLEAKLVCPVNLVGEVDVYQVNHHGLDMSNNPVLIQSIKPAVTIMNNGHRKGCQPKTRSALKATASIQANYQLHKNLAPGADNTPDEYIANFEPPETCRGNHVALHVAPDGSRYTVEVPATGHKREFRSKPPATQGKQAGDAFLGDWHGAAPEGARQRRGPVAQVFPVGGGEYQINFLPAFDQRCRPWAVVRGKAEGDVLRFDQNGWAGEVRGGRLLGKGTMGNRQVAIEMANVTRPSPRLGAKCPEGAVALFDGGGFDQWEPLGRGGATITWQCDKGVMRAWPPLKEHTFGTSLGARPVFADFQLHLEFRLPLLPEDSGQTRANSGVIIEDYAFHEVQILDSYGLPGYDDECGAIYKAAAPKVNMCAPPLQWQSYDITYHAARYDAGGKLIRPGRITVDHNGKLIHKDLALRVPTGGQVPQRLIGNRKLGRIRLQHHGDPVEFRNIWMLELKPDGP